ncbi:MAG: hypothetical protein E6G42_08630 [Actinobacteria bacterium]|nr:MAG: hypothetical protein E6G42_08630 [Actinomycetota bacterium]
MRIVAIAALCCIAGAPVGGSAGPKAPPAPSRQLWYGPVLAGARVVWLESDGSQLVLESGAPGRRAAPLFRQDGAWLDDLAASPAVIALERRTMTCPPPAPPIGHTCSEQREVLGGSPAGPFDLLAASDDCGGGAISVWPSVDVSGTVVAIGENVCLSPGDRRRRILVARPGESRPRVLFPRIESYDLQRDGKLVVAYHLRSAAAPAWVAWRSQRSDGRGLPFRIRISDRRNAAVRIAADRILVERALSRTSSALVLSDLHGRTRRIARFAGQVRRAGDFDLDGTRVTWASTRVTSSHTECPPPGIMTPCVLEETGVTTIRLGNVAGGAPQVVARLPFHDVARS